MQVEVHGAQAPGCGHKLEASGDAPLQVPLLVKIEIGSVLIEDILVGSDQEATGAAGRVTYGIVRIWSRIASSRL